MGPQRRIVLQGCFFEKVIYPLQDLLGSLSFVGDSEHHLPATLVPFFVGLELRRFLVDAIQALLSKARRILLTMRKVFAIPVKLESVRMT